MLTKLLKYDFKSLFKPLIPIYLIALLVSVLQKVVMSLSNDVSIFRIPSGFITMFYVLILIGLPIATFIFSIVRYYSNLSKDEGYLMHTIPVKKSVLVLSKLIVASVAMVVTIVVMFLCLIITFFNVLNFAYIFSTIKFVFGEFNILFMVVMVLSMIVGAIQQQLLFYFSMALGQIRNTRKILFSIIYGVVIYNVLQLVMALFIFVPALISKEFSSLLYNNIDPSLDFINTYLVIMVVVNVIISVGFFIGTIRILEKKLNLE